MEVKRGMLVSLTGLHPERFLYTYLFTIFLLSFQFPTQLWTKFEATGNPPLPQPQYYPPNFNMEALIGLPYWGEVAFMLGLLGSLWPPRGWEE